MMAYTVCGWVALIGLLAAFFLSIAGLDVWREFVFISLAFLAAGLILRFLPPAGPN